LFETKTFENRRASIIAGNFEAGRLPWKFSERLASTGIFQCFQRQGEECPSHGVGGAFQPLAAFSIQACRRWNDNASAGEKNSSNRCCWNESCYFCRGKNCACNSATLNYSRT